MNLMKSLSFVSFTLISGLGVTNAMATSPEEQNYRELHRVFLTSRAPRSQVEMNLPSSSEILAGTPDRDRAYLIRSVPVACVSAMTSFSAPGYFSSRRFTAAPFICRASICVGGPQEYELNYSTRTGRLVGFSTPGHSGVYYGLRSFIYASDPDMRVHTSGNYFYEAGRGWVAPADYNADETAVFRVTPSGDLIAEVGLHTYDPAVMLNAELATDGSYAYKYYYCLNPSSDPAVQARRMNMRQSYGPHLVLDDSSAMLH